MVALLLLRVELNSTKTSNLIGRVMTSWGLPLALSIGQQKLSLHLGYSNLVRSAAGGKRDVRASGEEGGHHAGRKMLCVIWSDTTFYAEGGSTNR